MPYRARVSAAAQNGAAAVAIELAQEGLLFDQQIRAKIRSDLAGYPSGNLFYKCIVAAAEWAGFVQNDPSWPVNGMRFLISQAPHIKQQYQKGYHANANPIAYLESWDAVMSDPNVPGAPDQRTTVHDLVMFYQAAFVALNQLDWRGQRSWLGPWTFHGAFKIYVLHEDRFWSNSALDAITMPMGGANAQYSFEAGWDFLVPLGIVPALQAGNTFATKMAVANQAHAMVQGLAALAGTRALHVNSGIYLLGSP